MIIMFSHLINKILTRNPYTGQYFNGCYSADRIPQKSNHLYPYCMVVNLDCSGWEGSHWVAIFVESQRSAEYYDSLGDWPPISPYIIAFLKQFANIKYNREQIQSSQSSSCGKHAIYFLIHRCSGLIRDVNEMTMHFKCHKRNPDLIVNSFVRNLMNI